MDLLDIIIWPLAVCFSVATIASRFYITITIDKESKVKI